MPGIHWISFTNEVYFNHAGEDVSSPQLFKMQFKQYSTIETA